MRSLVVVSSIALVSLVVVACKEDDAAPDPSTADGACAAYFKGAKAYQARCPLPSTSSLQFVTSVADEEAHCRKLLSVSGITEAQRRATATCGDKLGGLPCDQDERDVAECQVRLLGTLADGTACAMGMQCASGMCKDSYFDPRFFAGPIRAQQDGTLIPCGVCVRMKSGDACATGPEGCSPGLFCDGGMCAPAGKLGEPCPKGASSCADGAACIAGTCARPRARGEACVTPTDCGGASSCTAGKCAAPVAAGQACGAEQVCGAGSNCVRPPGATNGTCTALKKLGEPCVAGECGIHECLNGVCTNPRAGAGAACDTKTFCARTLECIGGKCQPIELCK